MINHLQFIIISICLLAHVYLSISVIAIVCHDIRLKTKYDAHLISWELGPCRSIHVFENYMEYIQRCCVPPGTQTLTCINKEKDEGWKSASLEYQSRIYCNDFMSYKVMSHVQVIGNVS